jgi:hypothetical protein
MNAPIASKGSKNFFFKKKAPRLGKQKTFDHLSSQVVPPPIVKTKQKFFASPGGAPFFQKRSSFLLSVP